MCLFNLLLLIPLINILKNCGYSLDSTLTRSVYNLIKSGLQANKNSNPLHAISDHAKQRKFHRLYDKYESSDSGGQVNEECTFFS
jgi:hypothetical protein